MTNMEKFLKNIMEEILIEHYDLFELFLHKWMGVEVFEDFDYNECSIDRMRSLGKMGHGSYTCPRGVSCSECMLGWLREEYKED